MESLYVEASRGEDEGKLIMDVEKQQIRGYNTDIMSSHLNNNTTENFKGQFEIEYYKPFTVTGINNNHVIEENGTEITSKGAG